MNKLQQMRTPKVPIPVSQGPQLIKKAGILSAAKKVKNGVRAGGVMLAGGYLAEKASAPLVNTYVDKVEQRRAKKFNKFAKYLNKEATLIGAMTRAGARVSRAAVRSTPFKAGKRLLRGGGGTLKRIAKSPLAKDLAADTKTGVMYSGAIGVGSYYLNRPKAPRSGEHYQPYKPE